MSTIPDQPGEAPTPAPDVVQNAPRRSRRALSAGALAVGLAVGGAGVAAAVSGNGVQAAGATTAPSSVTAGGLNAATSPTPSDKPGTHKGRGFGRFGGALHGELTVPQSDGTGTRVILVQRGTVTAVSSTSLSVKSSDGFTATYTISSTTRVRAAGSNAISGVKKDATVWVVATKAGAALRVIDRAAGPMGHGMRGDRDRQAPPTGTPTPGSTSGTSLDQQGATSQL